MKRIRIDRENIKGFVGDKDLDQLLPEIKKAHDGLENRSCKGSEYLGWLDLPDRINHGQLGEIEELAASIRKKSAVFILIGIGGSYLGARAAINFINPLLKKDKKIKFYYCGHNLCGDYLNELLDELKNEDEIYVNVISKSGTTTEPAIAFRIIREFLIKRYGRIGLKDRIIATTDGSKGVLGDIAKEEGYRTFVIPGDIGGRFSVLTPVGLLPIAASGIDIRKFIKGAKDLYSFSKRLNYSENPAYLYAAIRYILSAKGKDIEILSNFHPSFSYVAEWWKQLFGESEGKDKSGIFPASCNFTTDLHSLGQLIQEGKRNIFETFLMLEEKKSKAIIPYTSDNKDSLNYIAGIDVEYVNNMAYLGTRKAHFDGGVPNLTIFVPERSEECLGQLIYFFEKAVSISGQLNGVNPFNQPGVEAYKKNMLRLLKEDIR